MGAGLQKQLYQFVLCNESSVCMGQIEDCVALGCPLSQGAVYRRGRKTCGFLRASDSGKYLLSHKSVSQNY